MRNKKQKELWLVVIMVLLILPALRTNSYKGETANEDSNQIISIREDSFINHIPIRIAGEEEFLKFIQSEGIKGTGVLEDPYRIENFVFDHENATQVIIKDVHIPFAFQKNIIKNGTVQGVYLENVTNVLVQDNVFTEVAGDVLAVHKSTNVKIINNQFIDTLQNANDFANIAIWVTQSSFVNVSHNNLDGVPRGAWLWGSDHSLLFNNTVRNTYAVATGLGIATSLGIGFSVNSTIANNTVHGSTTHVGIWLWSINDTNSNNLVEFNTVEETAMAVRLDASSNNIIRHNLLKESKEAVVISSSTGNEFNFNHFINSSDHDVRLGSNTNRFAFNIFESSDEVKKPVFTLLSSPNVTFEYNYYSAWSSPDGDVNGIVDNAFYLSDSTSLVDLYPLAVLPDVFIEDYLPNYPTETLSTGSDDTSYSTSTTNKDDGISAMAGIDIFPFLLVLLAVSYIIKRPVRRPKR